MTNIQTTMTALSVIISWSSLNSQHEDPRVILSMLAVLVSGSQTKNKATKNKVTTHFKKTQCTRESKKKKKKKKKFNPQLFWKQPSSKKVIGKE